MVEELQDLKELNALSLPKLSEREATHDSFLKGNWSGLRDRPGPSVWPWEEGSLAPETSASLSCRKEAQSRQQQLRLQHAFRHPFLEQRIEASSTAKQDDVNGPDDSEPPSPSYQSRGTQTQRTTWLPHPPSSADCTCWIPETSPFYCA